MKKNLIFIPTYNEINNIENLLNKIRKLYPKFDILIVDDNSTDGTVSYLKKISDERSEFKIIEEGIGPINEKSIKSQKAFFSCSWLWAQKSLKRRSFFG